MIFCGQCGLQLAAGTATCPRCGTTVEDANADVDALHANDNTVAGQSIHLSQAGTVMQGPPPPQQLILRPGTTTSNYNPQDATSMMEAPTYGTNMPPGQPIPTQYPAGGHYPPQASYPPNYSMHGGTYAPAGMSSPGMTNQMGYPAQQNTNTSNGNPTLRVAGLIVALFGIILILSAVILLILQQSGTL
jgi:hypothetical protein